MTICIHKLKEGKRHTLYALGNGQAVEALDFMDDMASKRRKELDKLNALIDRSLDHGPPKNKEKCNFLGDGVWEFKTGGGLRLLWFWDAGQMIVCTHGYVKASQKAPRGQIERALAKKDEYFKAKDAGTLLKEDDE
jgi:phage-related protein